MMKFEINDEKRHPKAEESIVNICVHNAKFFTIRCQRDSDATLVEQILTAFLSTSGREGKEFSNYTVNYQSEDDTEKNLLLINGNIISAIETLYDAGCIKEDHRTKISKYIKVLKSPIVKFLNKLCIANKKSDKKESISFKEIDQTPTNVKI